MAQAWGARRAKSSEAAPSIARGATAREGARKSENFRDVRDRVHSRAEEGRPLRARLELVLSFIVAGVLIAAAHYLPHVVAPRPIAIAGSDTMRPLTFAWGELYEHRDRGVAVTVTSGGSGAGIAALAAGLCDIAASSRPMKKHEVESFGPGHAPRAFVVAIDAVVVAVHPSNPVEALTIAELSDIYTRRKRSWKDFGGPDRPIKLLARDPTSGTHVFFLEHVVRQGAEAPAVQYTEDTVFLGSSREVVERVAADPDAIGYFGLAYRDARTKALAVAERTGKDPFPPRAEEAASGRYPVSRPLYLYTAGDPRADVQELLELCVSPEGQERAKRLDFVPLPKPGVLAATLGK
jgi:phosphate transport system substrate-binding protein